MDVDYAELTRILKAARRLSTWGPNFDEFETSKAWCEKIDHIPIDVFKKNLAKLAGHEKFPALHTVLELCQSEIRQTAPAPSPFEFPIPEILRKMPKMSKAENEKLMNSWNDRGAENETRIALYWKILQTDEGQYLQRHYPNDYYHTLFQVLCCLSYHEEFHPLLKHWETYTDEMLREIFPGKKFDFDPRKKGR